MRNKYEVESTSKEPAARHKVTNPKKFAVGLGLVGLLVLTVVLAKSALGCLAKVDLMDLPIGSDLRELDANLRSSSIHEGEVARLSRTSSADGLKSNYVHNEFGDFKVENLGSYFNWRPSLAERKSFTGEVKLYETRIDFDDFPSSQVVIILVYIDGVLKKKDWGRLPG